MEATSDSSVAAQNDRRRQRAPLRSKCDASLCLSAAVEEEPEIEVRLA